MKITSRPTLLAGLGCLLATMAGADDPPAPGAAPALPRAFIDGSGPGWKSLGEADFTRANCDPETFTWQGGTVHCTGLPVGVLRSKEILGNFELVARWRHLKSGGNSGFFVWAPPEALEKLKPGALPNGGIEVQVLDHGYAEQFEKQSGKKADWFTTNGDVFAVGKSKMKPFPPLSPNGSRSFPSKALSKGVPEWNHYYVRAINGEVRLWVNGEEVSGGSGLRTAPGLSLPGGGGLAGGVRGDPDSRASLMPRTRRGPVDLVADPRAIQRVTG